ncbi:MAG TPA: Gmad2 immunoglobulin-like domain-containing protein [Gaiellaceae bacterium]
MRRLTLLLLAAALAGCGGKGAAPPPPAPPTTTTTHRVPVSPPPMTLTVFRAGGGRLRAEAVHVPRTRQVAAAALGALGVAGTVRIGGGTATVTTQGAPSDARVAEIVYTLTQFPAVQRVDVAGRTGLTRDDVAAYLPPILVESPPDGGSVPQTFHVSGTASVFEATLVVRLVRGGSELSKQTVTASEGAPGRGTFDAVAHASPGPIQVQVYAPSAANGDPQHEVDVRVTVTP